MHRKARNIVFGILYWGFALSYIFIPCEDWTKGTLLKIAPLILLLAMIIIRRKAVCTKSNWNLWTIGFALLFSIGGDIAGRFKNPANDLPVIIQASLFTFAQFCYILEFQHHHRKKTPGDSFTWRISIVSALGIYLCIVEEL